MKKMILSVCAIAFTGIFASNAQISLQGQEGTANMLSYTKRTGNDASTIAGKQFINDQFSSAYVNNGNTAFQIRFNPYLNVMEYKKDGELLNLTRDQNTVVKFLGGSGATYVLTDYVNKRAEESKDYMRVVYEGKKIQFLVLEKINLKPATKASNSYETDKQAEYIRAKDEIFMTYNEKTFSSPSKVKDLIKVMPSHEKEIKAFVKTNNIDFNKEFDLKKLGAFLDGLS